MKHLIVFVVLLSLVLAGKSRKSPKIKLSKLHRKQHHAGSLQTHQQQRITNGTAAKKNDFPYQVGLAFEKDCVLSWCGGSLIGDAWVLTSAHCTDGAESGTVYLGDIKRAVGEVTYNISRANIYQHPGYAANPLVNNIALIEIPAVTRKSSIATVSLPALTDAYKNYTGEYALASGWGRTNETWDELSPKLQYAKLPIISDYECAQTFGGVVLNNTAILCTSIVNGTATCNGDSGGPLVLDSSKELVGITIFSSAAGCTAGKASGFVSVNYYLEWIKNVTKISY